MQDDERKGQWLIVSPIYPGISDAWRCSECGSITIRNISMSNNNDYRFCPYCGAKMNVPRNSSGDGGEKNEQGRGTYEDQGPSENSGEDG